jgi:cell wall-associated NlpC family hydrolase
MSRALAVLVCACCFAGCATDPPERLPSPRTVVVPPASAEEPSAEGLEILRAAEAQIGVPYRFGGATEAGFDCSGLVFFVHQRLGRPVARTARAQFDTLRAVDRAELAPGDLVFFRLGAAAVDHVGIYAGGGRFVHAPRTGGSVRYDSLDDPYFVRGFAGARRTY